MACKGLEAGRVLQRGKGGYFLNGLLRGSSSLSISHPAYGFVVALGVGWVEVALLKEPSQHNTRRRQISH